MKRSQSGQALVEVAVLAGLLLLLVGGAIDFGRFTYDGIVLGNGARAGAQYGAQSLIASDDATGMIAAANADMPVLPGAAATTATTYCTCAGGVVTCTLPSPGSCTSANPRLVFVKVTTSGSFTPWVAFPGLPSSLAISRDAIMQVSP